MTTPVVLDGNSLTIDDVFAVAVESVPVSLAPLARQRAQASRRHIETLVERKAVAYGVTTGFGNSPTSSFQSTGWPSSRSISFEATQRGWGRSFHCARYAR